MARYAVIGESGKNYNYEYWVYCEKCWDPLFLLSLSEL